MLQSGLHFGTIGGGKVEAKAIAYSRELLQNLNSAPRAEVVTWNLQKDVAMSCGGEVSFVFEVHHSKPWKIAVFGAGHVAQALVRALVPLNCHVQCFDHREEWVRKLPESQKLTRKVVANISDGVAECNSDTFFVVMTQGHATDVPTLKKIYEHFPNAPFIGCMGSPVKANKMKKELLEIGVQPIYLEKFRSPIGLNLGSNDPAEIAISVVAQLLQERDLFLETSSLLKNDQ